MLGSCVTLKPIGTEKDRPALCVDIHAVMREVVYPFDQILPSGGGRLRCACIGDVGDLSSHLIECQV